MLGLSACGRGFLPRTPETRTADEIEARLSKVPCIGPMSRWERHYSFASKPFLDGLFGWQNRWYDYSTIEISYRQAGFDEFRPRRVLYHGSEPLGIDDRNYELVFGHYDIPAHTAYIWACGPNFAGSDDDPGKPHIIVR